MINAMMVVGMRFLGTVHREAQAWAARATLFNMVVQVQS